MKISFQQQTAVETEKHYAEKAHSHRSTNSSVNYQAVISDRKEELWGGVAGTGREKGKSLIELQQEAGNMNVAVQQDYMTVMSHTMSEKDYAKLQEEGFHFESMDPDTAVTIVDKIKAELVRAGKHIAGYTDDIDMDTLAAAVGSEVLAAAMAQSFQQADIPLTEENVNDVVQAWNMAAELRPLEEGTTGYLIDNEMEAEIWNLYLAQNSGAGNGAAGAPRFYAEDIQGYYSQSAQTPEEADLTAQIDKVILQSGREVNEESRRGAQWLLEKGYPLTAENLERLEKLGELELPVSEESFADAAAAAIAEGRKPVHGNLAGEGQNIYERAAEVAAYYQSSEILERYAGDITARRQLEEIRLRMTAEINVKLLKSGFSIDTAPMEELVEALKQAEAELARQYFPGDAEAVEKYRSFTQTNNVMAEIPGLPAQVLGTFAEGQATATLEEFHGEGKALEDTYRKAQTEYEALMTAPRGDLGDSIKKAFANVDDILQDMGLELTEENRRAARILGYNRMEMTVENIEAVRVADDQVRNVVEKMTPATVMKMIRDGMNPLEKSFSELERYFEALPEDYREASESYARFLYGLEKNHGITEDERAGYIGVYRLIRQIEKSDGAAVGALVNTQAELHFSNLLTAVRSGKVKSLDKKAADEMGVVTELLRKGESISDQIAKGFAGRVKDILTEVSYREEAEAEYNRALLDDIRQAAQTDGDSAALLQRGEMTATAENLMAAQALLHGTEDIFAAAGQRKEAERPGAEETAKLAEAAEMAETDDDLIHSLKLWQKLEEKEAFREAYAETVEESYTAAEEASLTADTSLDVRRMQLVHKQLTVVSQLARQEEYIVPMYIGDNLSRVHLTFARGGGQKSAVEISVHVDNGESLEASLSLENGTIHGIFTGKTEQEVMKLQRVADTFKEEAGRNWTVGDIHIVTSDRTVSGTNAAGENTTERADNAELYRVAKVFLHAVNAERSKIPDMRINYNVSAMLSNNALANNDSLLAQSLERLSSGLKVNHAKDNPAGLAMAKRMNAQIEGLNVANQNASDGVSVISIADGALSEVSDMLQRMNELAVKAANGTMTEEDNAVIQQEIEQLKEEITRISETTEFNGQKLLNGEFSLKGYINDPAALDIKVNSYTTDVPAKEYTIDNLSVGGKDADGNYVVNDGDITLGAGFPSDATVSVEKDLLTIKASNGFEMKLDLSRIDETTGQSFPAGFTIDATGIGAMRLQIGANEGQVLPVDIPALTLQNMGIEDLKVDTTEDAQRAIADIKGAITYVSSLRGKLGAYQNRLESTINSLDISVENMTAAYSRLMDVDMAEEMTNYTTYQVLTQAGTSMLAQANERPSQVLQLLQ